MKRIATELQFFFHIFLVNPDWKYFQNITWKNRHFNMQSEMASHFADQCISSLSEVFWALFWGIVCLNQLSIDAEGSYECLQYCIAYL